MATCSYCGTKYLHQQLLRLPDYRCGACGGALEEMPDARFGDWQEADQYAQMFYRQFPFRPTGSTVCLSEYGTTVPINWRIA